MRPRERSKLAITSLSAVRRLLKVKSRECRSDSEMRFATFVSTWMDDEAKKLYAEAADKNMIDKDEYPQTAELEARCVHMLADLWNSPGGRAKLPDGRDAAGKTAVGQPLLHQLIDSGEKGRESLA